MAGKRKSLGRGLDALLGPAPAAPSTSPDDDAPAPARRDGLRMLPLDLLQRGAYQPRRDMHTESLNELAESIRAQGVVQPIVVRPIDAERFEIVAGERRWHAAQLAGLDEIPALVRDIDDASAAAIALIENIQRENLNPIEVARGLNRLKEEHELTHQALADAIGRSRTAVTNLLRLLDLEDAVKQLLIDGALEMGHARALLGLSARRQVEAARKVAARGLSVRATEQLVRKLNARKTTSRRTQDPDVQRLENSLSETLGAKVTLIQGQGGKGKLMISYNSLDELDGILAHIK